MKLNFSGGSSFSGNQSGNWRSRVAQLVAEKCVAKAKDPSRPTSNRTRVEANLNVQRLFGWLRQKLGFSGLSNPLSLDERHFVALAGYIRARAEAGEIGAARAAGYATYSRHLARWIDKPQFVQVFNGTLGKDVCKRNLIADRDKSWEGSDVNVEQKIMEAVKVERWVGLVLWSQHLIGMRKNEALMFQPLSDIKAIPCTRDYSRLDKRGRPFKQDLTLLHWSQWIGGVNVSIHRGTKGKRARVLSVNEDNSKLLESAHTLLVEMRHFGDRETFGPPNFTLKQNTRIYERVLARCGITQKHLGITGHGLRAGFAITMLEGYDITPTVRGGDGQHADPVHQRMAYKATTEAMGHGRISVIGAYCGPITPQALAQQKARQKKARAHQVLLTARASGPSATEEMATLVTQRAEQHDPNVTELRTELVTPDALSVNAETKKQQAQ